MRLRVGSTVVFYLDGSASNTIRACSARTCQVIRIIDDETLELNVLIGNLWQLVEAKRADHPRPEGTWDYIV